MAARRAKLEFGSTEHYKDKGARSRGLRRIDELRVSWLDFKLGFRMLARYPGLTLVGGLAMAVTIGLGAAMFTIYGSFAGSRLPLEDDDRIVAIQAFDIASQNVRRLTPVAEFTPRSAHTVVERVSDVVAPYGLGRLTVDGNDVVATWDAFGGFLASARAGGGPFLLECLTHRVRGHYEGDADRYREALADEEWQEKDTILRLERHGVAEGWFAEEELRSIAAAAAEDVEDAVRFARESPFPPAELVESMVYADA